MTRREFQQLPEADRNRVLRKHLLGRDDLPATVLADLEAMNRHIGEEMPGEIAFDLAMNDKGAAIDRCNARAGSIQERRDWYLLQAYTDLLQQHGHLTVC